MEYEKIVSSIEETEKIAYDLAKHMKPQDTIALEGDLGAGKTTFTKAFAKALGITRTVNSPTFTIMKQYDGNIPLNHLDVYRLNESDEDLGFDEIFYGDAITIVEWAHIIEEYLPEERLTIEIYQIGPHERKFVFKPIGERFERLCKELFQ